MESPDAIRSADSIRGLTAQEFEGTNRPASADFGVALGFHFSIGSLILGVFKNLIVKAITAPFSLIAAAFGGSGSGAQQELGYIEFAPGYATLTPDSQQKLDTIAKALADRTGLKLNISGRVDPAFDKEGYREASLEHSIQRAQTQG